MPPHNCGSLFKMDIIALPLGESGFNIPRLQARIHTFRLNTLRRLLEPQDTHQKYLVSYFLRVSHIRAGKLNLVLKYNRNHIESSTLPFHEELLLAWLIHKQLRQRVHPPEKLPYIPAGPLFQNELTSVNQEPVTLPDWNSAGITQIKDLTYETLPGFLPTLAIDELLTKHREESHRPLSRTAREPTTCGLKSAQKTNYNHLKLCNQHQNTRNPPVDILTCKIRHFYSHLQTNQQTPIPAVEYWTTNLQSPSLFNKNQWKTLYPHLANNKQGDVNQKIAHRTLHTELNLNRMGVWPTPNCDLCNAVDALLHALVECPAINQFCKEIQQHTNKFTGNTITLTTGLNYLERHLQEVTFQKEM